MDPGEPSPNLSTASQLAAWAAWTSSQVASCGP